MDHKFWTLSFQKYISFANKTHLSLGCIDIKFLVGVDVDGWVLETKIDHNILFPMKGQWETSPMLETLLKVPKT